jgi:hypothetical protein
MCGHLNTATKENTNEMTNMQAGLLNRRGDIKRQKPYKNSTGIEFQKVIKSGGKA